MTTDKQLKGKYLSEVNLSHVQETIMLQRILNYAEKFYSSPENIKAFEKWLDIKSKTVDKFE